MSLNLQLSNTTNLNPNNIPKIIHYVWVGGAEKSEFVLKCINSWKKYMPDYEIIEWNESNFNIDMIDYTREAYNQKKWAFVSDAIRTFVLKEYGGVYFDTDVELFCEPKEIFCKGDVVLGFDTKFLLSTGVMATIPKNEIFEKLWSQYISSHFVDSDEEETINTRLTFIVVDYIGKKKVIDGEYFVKNIKIFPCEYFSNNGKANNKPIFAIHYFAGTWKKKTQLTFLQYIIFASKFKFLSMISIFLSTKTYIKINDSFWRAALKKTNRNLEKNANIYKIL